MTNILYSLTIIEVGEYREISFAMLAEYREISFAMPAASKIIGEFLAGMTAKSLGRRVDLDASGVTTGGWPIRLKNGVCGMLESIVTVFLWWDRRLPKVGLGMAQLGSDLILPVRGIICGRRINRSPTFDTIGCFPWTSSDPLSAAAQARESPCSDKKRHTPAVDN
jgi:hypothetical protein